VLSPPCQPAFLNRQAFSHRDEKRRFRKLCASPQHPLLERQFAGNFPLTCGGYRFPLLRGCFSILIFSCVFSSFSRGGWGVFFPNAMAEGPKQSRISGFSRDLKKTRLLRKRKYHLATKIPPRSDTPLACHSEPRSGEESRFLRGKRDCFGNKNTRFAITLPPRHAELDSASQRRDPETSSG